MLDGFGTSDDVQPLREREHAHQIEGNDPEWGHPLAVIRIDDWTIFGFSGGGIYRVRTAALIEAFGSTQKRVEFEEVTSLLSDGAVPSCFCIMTDDTSARLLVGDTNGRIGVIVDGAYKMLVDLTFTLRLLKSVAVQVTVMEPVECTMHEKQHAFVVVGSDLGYVFVFEWKNGGLETNVARLRVATASITSLLIVGDSVKQVVAGCSNGRVVGSWLLVSDDDGPSLRPYWGYVAGDAVRCLRRLPARSSGPESGYDLIGIGSHDEHLHIVDHAGRHRETILLRGVKIDRFAAVSPGEGDEAIECIVYLCGFENSFHCLRLVSRTVLINALQGSLNEMSEEARELSLSRWRSFAIQEGHLRHRFVRQSVRYPGLSPHDTIREIRRVLSTGDGGERATGVITALLRRLFQNAVPGETSSSVSNSGTRAILADPALYDDVVLLLTELEEQWNTPGSVSNRRAQYFWIRSLLRGIEDLDMLRQWTFVATKTSDTVAAAPHTLLYHFLEHASDLVQFKVLQRVERMLFGWPAVAQRGVLATANEIQRSDIEWILTATMRRLRLSPSQVSADEPNVIILQIGKILCHLLRLGCLDSLYLTDVL
ncbi:MAG TPA: hypothetical protein VNN08_01480, partial [Thermoanaerobaculia bacterium]|nr:hypothetical protein [Thermoanaerobaculia bacterium]